MLRRGARVALSALLGAGAAAPYTRRSQLILISPEEENKLGARAFQQVLGKSHVDGRAQVNGPVEGVGQRLARVAERPDYQWRFVAIDDPKQQNAFCLPGGKVAVYTGIFPLAESTNGLAVWQRMERAAGGAPPEFLSTHPSHGTREQQIQAWLPEAMRYYEASAHAGVEPLPAIAGAMARSTPRSDRAHEFFTCNRFRAGVSAPFLVLSFPYDATG